jgi:hypothetical protein
MCVGRPPLLTPAVLRPGNLPDEACTRADLAHALSRLQPTLKVIGHVYILPRLVSLPVTLDGPHKLTTQCHIVPVFAKSKKGKETANEPETVAVEENEDPLEDDDLFGGSSNGDGVAEGSAREANASKERSASRNPGDRPAPDTIRPTFNTHIAEFKNRIKSENSSGTEREELRRVLNKQLRRITSGEDVTTPLSLAEIRALIECMELVRFRTGLSLGVETSTKLRECLLP